MSSPETAPAAATATRRPPRILVVDDERSMRELLAIVLRREGYEVVLAENGRAVVPAKRQVEATIGKDLVDYAQIVEYF